MSAPAFHEHTCRDCGGSITCTTPDTYAGCPAFSGSCNTCTTSNQITREEATA